jgi:glycosyltransferase involved in cell wall biosynthesis
VTGLVIVPEQVADLGGSERVLDALVRRYPRAEVVTPHFTSTNVPPGGEPPWARKARLVGRGGRRRPMRAPLHARRLARARISDARVVLSLTHAGWSLAARVPPGARHVCYCAGLPRSLYRHWPRMIREEPVVVRPLLVAAIPALRAHYRSLMRRPHRLVTNSLYSAARLARVHGRSAEVVYPPLRADLFEPSDAPREHFLAVGRIVPQKRIEVVVEAFRDLDAQLVVAGDGVSLRSLRSRAPRNVRFTGFVGDDELRDLYRRSAGLVCPSVEDFGLVMAEALASGTPVIAPRAGGALEIVSDGETGLLLERVDARSVAAAVRRLASWRPAPGACRAAAERFAEPRFIRAMERVMAEELELARRVR